MDSSFDYLDALAARVAEGNLDCVDALSTGEYLYVALASNSLTLLRRKNYSIVQAVCRLGPQWLSVLKARWQYRHTQASEYEPTP